MPTTRRSRSLALQVGAIIEEFDILDLEERLAGTTGGDIIRVYENLLRGSENHLRAFVSQLELAGIDRAPTHMSEDAYRAIIGSGTDRGGSSGSGHNGDGACDESGHGQHGRGQGGRGLDGQSGSTGPVPEPTIRELRVRVIRRRVRRWPPLPARCPRSVPGAVVHGGR